MPPGILGQICCQGRLDMLRFLLSPSSNLSLDLSSVYAGDTPLGCACSANQYEIARELLRDPRVDVKQAQAGPLFSSGGPLMSAFCVGALRIVKLILISREVHISPLFLLECFSHHLTIGSEGNEARVLIREYQEHREQAIEKFQRELGLYGPLSLSRLSFFFPFDSKFKLPCLYAIIGSKHICSELGVDLGALVNNPKDVPIEQVAKIDLSSFELSQLSPNIGFFFFLFFSSFLLFFFLFSFLFFFLLFSQYLTDSAELSFHNYFPKTLNSHLK